MNRTLTKRMLVDVAALLRFYDELPEGRRHASAVKGVAGEELSLALLLDYFGRRGKKAAKVGDVCSTGRARGPRLDAWIRVGTPSRGTLYQVEAKNWSAHSLQGKAIAAIASEGALRAHKRERWQNQYWNGRTFWTASLRKVLRPMRPPVPARRVLPLACIWDPVHPTGGQSPFFRVKLRGRAFPEVWVFSVSAYLRGIRRRWIRLSMPDLAARLRHLRRIFPSG